MNIKIIAGAGAALVTALGALALANRKSSEAHIKMPKEEIEEKGPSIILTLKYVQVNACGTADELTDELEALHGVDVIAVMDDEMDGKYEAVIEVPEDVDLVVLNSLLDSFDDFRLYKAKLCFE